MISFADVCKVHCLWEHTGRTPKIQVGEGIEEGFLEELILELSLDEGVKLIQMKEGVSFLGRRDSMWHGTHTQNSMFGENKELVDWEAV